MPYKSRFPCEPPYISVPSFIFGLPTATIEEKEPVIIDANRPDTHFLTKLTYREWAKRFAAGLRAAGLKQGDRVMLFSGNNIFTPIVIMGTLMAGGIYNSTNPAYTANELAYQLKICQPSFLLVADICMERAILGARQAGFNRNQIYLFSEPELSGKAREPSISAGSHKLFKDLIASAEYGAKFTWEELDTKEKSGRTALLIFSSGTTGLPKGVEVSHRNLVANIMQLTSMQTQTRKNPTKWVRRGLCCLPMYHALGLTFYNFVSPKAGIQVYLMERWNLEEVLDHIQHFKISELVMVPPMILGIAKYPKIRDYDLSSIRKVQVGAAPLGLELTAQFESIWDGRVRIRQVWGMSEQPCMVTAWHEDQNDDPPSFAVGELLPGCEAILMRPDGTEETRPGERGEIWIRGPNVMNGYWRNPTATEAAITKEGWLISGDVCYADEHSKFYVVDRIKELIKVRGAQVAPAELEALLLEHDDVVDAAVIGIKTETGDENPRAYVVPRDSQKVTPEDIKSWINGRVSKLKHITGGLVFVNSIPKNPSGKILRRELRELAAREASNGKMQSRL